MSCFCSLLCFLVLFDCRSSSKKNFIYCVYVCECVECSLSATLSSGIWFFGFSFFSILCSFLTALPVTLIRLFCALRHCLSILFGQPSLLLALLLPLLLQLTSLSLQLLLHFFHTFLTCKKQHKATTK